MPLSGIDPLALKEIMATSQKGLLGMFNMFSGGAVTRMAIFALGIMPYISASIIVQLLTGVSDYFKNYTTGAAAPRGGGIFQTSETNFGNQFRQKQLREQAGPHRRTQRRKRRRRKRPIWFKSLVIRRQK